MCCVNSFKSYSLITLKSQVLNLINVDEGCAQKSAQRLMKLKQLEQELQKIPPFLNPKIEFEQYPTTAHLAAHMLFTADSFEDLHDKTVLDLGVGCGMLTIGSIIMGASSNIGVDIDSSALEQTKTNLDDFGAECTLIQGNIQDLMEKNASEIHHLVSDTVVMNPPFGTKKKGADMDFLRFAARVARNAIYTLHKTSTREHVLRVGESLGLKNGKVIAELEYDLPNTYKFHKKKNVAIQVDFIRFEASGNHSESSDIIGLR